MRDEDTVLDPPGTAVDALDPPGRVAADLDPRLADQIADLPVCASAVRLDVEVLGEPEVALAPGRQPDLAADPGDAKRSVRVAVVVPADHVPAAGVEQEGVRVDRPLLLLVPRDGVVVELDRALLRDRALELCEPAGRLGRVVHLADLHPVRGAAGRPLEGGPSESEVLEREPERLGVREASLQQEERGLERRQLVVGELELTEEVALGAERVELLAREFVPLRVERHPQGEQLGAVGVEPAGERLVRHLRVALDVSLDVARGERTSLRHQKGDEGELSDQLVGVVRHGRPILADPTAAPESASSRCPPRQVPNRLCNSDPNLVMLPPRRR